MSEEPVIWKKYSVIINLLLIIITAKLAYFTYGLYSSSQKSLDITRESVKQQGDYYEATTRPFINISIEKNSMVIKTIEFEPLQENSYVESEKTTTFEDTLSQKGKLLVECSYTIENFGFLPAKEIQSSLKFIPYPEPTLRRIYLPDKSSFSLYPKSKIYTVPREMKVFWNDKKHTFLHCAISYKDEAGTEYYSLSIIKYIFDNNGILIKSTLFKSFFD